MVCILRPGSDRTFCGKNARFVRVVMNNDVFGIASAMDSGNLCRVCMSLAGV